MKRYWVALLLLVLTACKEAPFDIDPANVYSAAELIQKTQGACRGQRPWDGKQVQVSGLIHQPTPGRFLLLDAQTRTPLTIIVAISDPAAMAQAMRFLQANESKRVTVTGVAKPEDIATQATCRSTVFVWIATQTAIQG